MMIHISTNPSPPPYHHYHHRQPQQQQSHSYSPSSSTTTTTTTTLTLTTTMTDELNILQNPENSPSLAPYIVQHYLKTQQCVDCGEKNWMVLENDHGHHEKSTNIHGNSIRTLSKNSTPLKIINELSKCEVVCILCHRIRTHRRWQNQPKKTYAAVRMDQYKTSRRKIVNQIKNTIGSCSCCHLAITPESEYLFDWDHLHPETKIDSISNMVKGSYTLEEITHEIGKCQLLCCKCHRIKNRTDTTEVNTDTLPSSILQQVNQWISQIKPIPTSSSSNSNTSTHKRKTRGQVNHESKKQQKIEQLYTIEQDDNLVQCFKCGTVPQKAMSGNDSWCVRCRRSWETNHGWHLDTSRTADRSKIRTDSNHTK